MVLRRGHLYFGLFLAPWAILYGLTAYLFNHPTHFSDQSLTSFGSQVVRSAGLQPIDDAQHAAASVVESLQIRFPDEAIALRTETIPAWSGESAFAEAFVDDTNYQLLLYRNATGGTLRTSQKSEPQAAPRKDAPFAIAGAGSESARGRGGRGSPSGERGGPGGENPEEKDRGASEPLWIDGSWATTAGQSLPKIYDQLGVELGESEPKLTSVPNLRFEVSSHNGLWQVNYNPLRGSVDATEATESAASELSWRRFLLRLHTTHGYPSQASSRWIWAIFVDIMAFVMLFWALSGFIMWWQLKRTLKWGAAVFATSAVLATYLAVGMHQELSGASQKRTTPATTTPTPAPAMNVDV